MAKTSVSINVSNDDLDWEVHIDRENQLVRTVVNHSDVEFALIMHVQDGLKLALALRNAVAELGSGK